MKKLNMREARRDLAGVKPAPKPEEPSKPDAVTVNVTVNAEAPFDSFDRLSRAIRDRTLHALTGRTPSGRIEVPPVNTLREFLYGDTNHRPSVVDRLMNNSQIQAEFAALTSQRPIFEEALRQEIVAAHPGREISFDTSSGDDQTVITVRDSATGYALGGTVTGRASGRILNDANLPFPALSRDSLQNRIAMLRPTAAETATQVQLQHEGRVARLVNQFNTKSEAALRREGITVSTHGVRPRDMVPSDRDVNQFFRRDGGPDHIEEVIAMVYWGYGVRRICIMECRMDCTNGHRGHDTNLALLAFKVRDTQDFGIQPFCGTANYNETVGFFIYQAQQGGRL